MEVLINAGADVNLVKKNVNALLVAANMAHYKCIEFLIEAGANVNFADPTITPALICAALTVTENIVNSRKTIEILIKAGADVHVRFKKQSSTITPLTVVAKYGSPRSLSMLLEAGADVNFGHGCNFSLHEAALRNRVENVELLIEAGMDVNQQESDGNTALGKTLVFDSQKTFSALMKLGADVNIVNKKGMTALMIAASYYPDQRCGYSVAELKTQKRCVQRTCHLLKAGAQIGRLHHLGNNSLQGSFKRNQKRINYMQMLLYAAGETLDGPTFATEDYSNGNIIHLNIPEYFTELKENLDLKHLYREAIRKHLIHLDPHEHLFGRIPQLGLPSLLTEYLLYDCSLDYKGAVNDEET